VSAGDPLPEDSRHRLMRAVQDAVPFEPRPFDQLGRALGLGEHAVLGQLRVWRERGLLREISAVLEGSAFGYDSALCAGEVPPDALARVVSVINAHPTVTHNYQRNHRYNLWFTIAVPPHMELERTLELLAREAGADAFHALRRTHTFKIGVNFDPETLSNRTRATSRAPTTPRLEVGAREQAMFRALQSPLSLEQRPFQKLARLAGASEGDLLEFARGHLGGAIRRYVGTLRHRKLGVRENGMSVWRVPEPALEEAGDRLAQLPEVSHCYARNPAPGFPYTLYGMLHGPDREACGKLAVRIAATIGVDDYAMLFSEREFKKQRLRYFLPELERWWDARAGGRGPDAGTPQKPDAPGDERARA
jgi:DNA-binding Lrp family transcriptional regulator